MGGGSDFWNLLNDCCVTHGSPKSAADVLRRQKLAIDLSLWMIQCGSATKQVPIRDLNADQVALRVLLQRTLRLCSTKHGAPQLVFVGDPQTPSPELALKNSTRALRYAAMTGKPKPTDQQIALLQKGPKPLIRNSAFIQRCKETQKMLKLMGFPCIFAIGEAEALCAQLNRCGLVDACVTPDGDSVCWGAQRVFKTLSVSGDRKVEVTIVDASDVQSKLGLGREELVACMLLLGCDFTDGVRQLGTAKTLKIMQQLTAAGLRPMQAIQAWMRGSDGGVAWAPDPREGGLKKPMHCGQCGQASCQYKGRKKKECEAAAPRASEAVSSPDSDSQAEEGSAGLDERVAGCGCSWCVEITAYNSQAFLRRARARVAAAHADTAAKVVDLYLKDLTAAEQARYASALAWKQPDVSGLCDLFATTFGWVDTRKTEATLLPLSTRWFFSAEHPEFCDYEPILIAKKRRTDDRFLYKVLWRKKGDDAVDDYSNEGPSASSTQDGASQADGGEDGELEPAGSKLETEEGAEFVEGCAAFASLLADFQARTAKPAKPEKPGKKKKKELATERSMQGLQDIRTLFKEKKLLNTSTPPQTEKKSDAANRGAGIGGRAGVDRPGGENNAPEEVEGRSVGGIVAKKVGGKAEKGAKEKAKRPEEEGKRAPAAPRCMAASASFEATAARLGEQEASAASPRHAPGSRAAQSTGMLERMSASAQKRLALDSSQASGTSSLPAQAGSVEPPRFIDFSGVGEPQPTAPRVQSQPPRAAQFQVGGAEHGRGLVGARAAAARATLASEPGHPSAGLGGQGAEARAPLVIDLSESQGSAGEVALLDVSGSSAGAEAPLGADVVEILDSP